MSGRGVAPAVGWAGGHRVEDRHVGAPNLPVLVRSLAYAGPVPTAVFVAPTSTDEPSFGASVRNLQALHGDGDLDWFGFRGPLLGAWAVLRVEGSTDAIAALADFLGRDPLIVGATVCFSCMEREAEESVSAELRGKTVSAPICAVCKAEGRQDAMLRQRRNTLGP